VRQGIARYASELNRSQGLGFCLHKQRLSPAFVSGVIVKTAAWLIVVLPTMAAFIRTGRPAFLEWDFMTVANNIIAGMMVLLVCGAAAAVARCRRNPRVVDLPIAELQYSQRIELNGMEGLKRLATGT